MAQPELKRVIGLPMLVLYGLGNMVGAGFYALTGKVAGLAAYHTPLAFLISALIAFFSAVSFAELCARFPVCAGPSHYAMQAFGRRGLSAFVGWCVITTGVVSAATISTAFHQFLTDLVNLPALLVVPLFVLILGSVAIWGISESVIAVNIISAITIGGLLYVAISRGWELSHSPFRLDLLYAVSDRSAWQGILAGSFLCFYAYIGFEDLVCNAEEIVEVEKNIGRGIFLSLALTLSLYIVVSSVAVLSLEPESLAASGNPMVALVGPEPRARLAMTLVSLIAGVNGALVQVVMASRMAYGMACQGNAPAWMKVVNEKTRTPVRATVFMTLIVLALALCFPLVTLAGITSLVMLFVFSVVNFSLIVIKVKERETPSGLRCTYPLLFPFLGFFSCLFLILSQVVCQLSGN